MKVLGENQTPEEGQREVLQILQNTSVLAPFYTEPVSREFGLDHILSKAYLLGLQQTDEKAIETLSNLLSQLEKAKKSSRSGEVNQDQCKLETQIIGVLAGKMVALDDVEYSPGVLDDHPDLPIWPLHEVAEATYIALKTASETKSSKKVIPFPQSLLSNQLKRSA